MSVCQFDACVGVEDLHRASGNWLVEIFLEQLRHERDAERRTCVELERVQIGLHDVEKRLLDAELDELPDLLRKQAILSRDWNQLLDRLKVTVMRHDFLLGIARQFVVMTTGRG